MNTAARLLRTLSLGTLLLVAPTVALAQGTRADYERADNLSTRLSPLIIGAPSAPTWLGSSGRFWYSVSVDGGNELRLVDATLQRSRRPAASPTPP